MLEVLAKFGCASIMTVTVFYLLSKITNTDIQKIRLKQIWLILMIAIISYILYPIQYSILYSLSLYFLEIIIFKKIFQITIEESIIGCAIMMIILFFSDLLSSIIFMSNFNIVKIRTNPIISIVSNLTVSIICIIIININIIKKQVNKFYDDIKDKRLISNIIFFLLIVIDFSYILYNIGISAFFRKEYIINFITMVIFIIITYIFIQNKNQYRNLENEYDNLFLYVQNFEDWIEKEQLNRHEYKNQLAVLRCLTKEQKVKNKIDEILEDSIDIEGQAVTDLKNLPKGGIKGLMYYKAAIAQKQKLKLNIEVNIEKNSILKNLQKKDIGVLCKLIGIYFDNSIEASAESRKKILTIEVYELSDKVKFIFSNTYKKHKNMKDRNKKGVSSKGRGRGNGLYFASKLIKENKWLEEKQEIIDNYYIQQIIIHKKKN